MTQLIRSVFLLSILSNCALHATEVIMSDSKENWNRLEVFQENNEPDRSFYVAYQNIENAAKPIDPLDPYALSENYLSLNGLWKFKHVEGLESRLPDFQQVGLDEGSWDEIPVPAGWQMFGHGELEYSNKIIGFFIGDDGETLPFLTGAPAQRELAKNPRLPTHYNPIGYYRKQFEVPSSWREERIFVHFAGVQGGCTYFINGHKLGYSEDGKLPTEFEITEYVQPGTNVLALEVMRYSTGSYLELQDATKTSGIQRDVLVYTRPKIHIWDFFAPTTFSETLDAVSIDLRTFLRGPIANDNISGIHAQIIDPFGKVVAETERFQASQSELKSDPSLLEYSSSLTVKNPLLWSPDKPSLHQLLIALKVEGQPADIIKSDLGFRKFEARGKQLFLNGKPLLMKGVNRHDHDPKLGKAMRPALFETDARLMKQLNINFVRNSHHPMDIRWYLICNRYGIAMIDEANLETHHFMQIIPGDYENWFAPSVDRMESMVFRSRNQPSVFIWSLGNEAATRYHKTFQTMEAASRKIDPTRLIMAEKRSKGKAAETGRYPGTADFVSPMYGGLGVMRSALALKNEDRPFFFCEYSHAFGNSMGSLDQMWEMIREHEMLNGGCIWDWADQTLYLPRPEDPSQFKLADGGEYGTRMSDDNGNADGIVTGDRRLTPECYEVKKVYEDIQFSSFDPSSGVLEISNEYIDSDLSEFALSYEITENGEVIHQVEIPTTTLAPGARSSIKIDLPKEDDYRGERHIRFSARTMTQTPWWPEGHEVAWMQFRLGEGEALSSPWRASSSEVIQVSQNAEEILIQTGGEVEIVFSKKNATIKSYRLEGTELLQEGGQFTIDSALVDNQAQRDEVRELYDTIMSDQYLNQVNRFELKESLGDFVEIHFTTRHGPSEEPLIEHEAIFKINGSGQIKCSHKVSALSKDDAKELARIATSFVMPFRDAPYRYFGKGPEDTYPDRASGAWLGIFDDTAAGIDLEMFSTLQECGNREATRWVELLGPHNKALRFDFDQPYSFSVLPYSQRELAAKKHAYQLAPSNRSILLINARLRGLGNKFSNTNSSFRDFLKEPVHFVYTITPIRSNL